MAASVVKKVRLNDEDAVELARLAKTFGVTESEILRHGIAYFRTLHDRRKNMKGLIEMANVGGPYKKIAFRLK